MESRYFRLRLCFQQRQLYLTPRASLTDQAIQGMLQDVPQKEYAAYLNPKASQIYLALRAQDQTASIGLYTSKPRGIPWILVGDVLSGGPAARAGVRRGDLLLRINGLPADEETLNTLHGTAGDPIRLTFWRGGCAFEKTLIRTTMNYGSVEFKRLPKHVYIKIRTFDSQQTYALITKALNQVPKDLPIIFDLRDNIGGRLDQVDQILSLFIEKKPLYFMGKNYSPVYPNQSLFKGSRKIIVLTNRATVSAGEIFTSSLEFNANALLMGEKTYGKGYTNAVYPLKNGAQLSFSIDPWFTAAKQQIDGKGLQPNIVFEDRRSPWVTDSQLQMKSCTPPETPLASDDLLQKAQQQPVTLAAAERK